MYCKCDIFYAKGDDLVFSPVSTMKTSRPALQTSSQEECGVWLDTVQLKGKAKQVPIGSRLWSGGYNVAVALNFTQTKMEMPKTKQSSISTFFTCQRRGRLTQFIIHITSMLSESPKKHSTLSPLKPFTDHTRAGSKLVSPRKHIPDQLWKRAHNKENSMSAQFKWIKPCSSPLKRQPPKGHEDSLAMLFTQDSEGFRVIAHRSLHARSLLKDQSNLNKSYSEDNEEEDMLFTQDSQGNMVIKH
uniref:Uncharacterized protein n=1 Tax=Sphaeramia orbicularis TaxID=375764 RepID=A0A672YSZ5_9TELE